MARYREKILPLAPTVLLLAFSFLVVFAPWSLGDRELSWTEGYLAAQAQGMRYAPLPLVTVHGEAIPNAFPLFPIFADALLHAGCTPEIALRLLSVLGLLGTAVLAFMVGLRTRGLPAAACACAMLLGSVLVIDKSSDGFNNWLFILALLGGHLSWYYFAAIRGDWSKAWLAGWTSCAVGFYINGGMAPLFFLGPLIFMRRPLGIFRRLRNTGFALGLGLFGVLFLVWYLPYHFEGVTVAAAYSRAGFLESWDYLEHVLTFPWDFGLRLLPWSLLAWAPFCVAFHTLDETPMFSRFLRTLFITDFFLLWLTPVDEVHDWLILVPPLAIMTGLNYELTVRRYGGIFRKIANALVYLMPAAGALMIFFYLPPAELLESLYHFARALDFSDRFGETVFGITGGVLLILSAGILLRMREKPPIWAYWLILSYAPLLFFHAVVQPYRAQEEPRRSCARDLAQALTQDGAAPGTPVYKYDFNDLFGEGVYMKSPLVRLRSLEALPKAEVPVVYLISPVFPALAERNWRSLLPAPLENHRRKLNLWKGEWLGTAPPERKRAPLVLELEPLTEGLGR